MNVSPPIPQAMNRKYHTGIAVNPVVTAPFGTTQT